MGLSASMWTSVSGLLAHGNKMNVVGNNIANVSTIGFKSQRMDFNDYLYINGGSTSGTVQIGAGVSTYAVLGDFSQGSLESTNSVTDIAIDGEGFFKVRKPNTEQMYYTRAGDFYFNADRQLQNPEGYRLQGWKVNANDSRLTFKSSSVNLGKTQATTESAFVGTGTPQDIVLESWYLEPLRTSSVKFTMGLTNDKKNDNATSSSGNPMTALWDQWNAKQDPPMPGSAIATSSDIKIYDEGGNPHTLTVYYDQVASKTTGDQGYEIEGLPAGYTMYEYIVTIPPAEDMRSFGGKNYNKETNTFDDGTSQNFYNADPDECNEKAGLLMTGHLIFDAAGNLVSQTAYTYGGSPSDDTVTTEIVLANAPNTKIGSVDSKGNFTPGDNVKQVMTGSTVTSESNLQAADGTDLGTTVGSITRNPDGTYNFTPINGINYDQTTGEVYIPDGTNRIPVGTFDNTTGAFTPASGRKIIQTTTSSEVVTADGTTVVGTIDANGKFTRDPGNTAEGAKTGGFPDVDNQYDGDPASLSSWQSTKFSSNGLPVFNANFTGQPLANSVCEMPSNTNRSQAEEYLIELNLGLRNLGGADGDWTDGASGTGPGGSLADLTVKNGKIEYNDIPKFADTSRDENATSAGTSSFVTQDATQNGYASGVLSGTNITTDGVVYGYYDNGETIPLYQIALYDFHNKQGLRREGGNLYAATKESGDPRQGVAGDNGFGVTRAYNIEGSNVDMSREFVNMITTQRGFQANSKGITTVDTMLETVIGMKR